MYRLGPIAFILGCLLGPAMGYSHQDDISASSWQLTALQRKVALAGQMTSSWCQEPIQPQSTTALACEWPRLVYEYNRSVDLLNNAGLDAIPYAIDSFYHVKAINNFSTDLFSENSSEIPILYYEHILIKNKLIVASFYLLANLNLNWTNKYFVHTYGNSQTASRSVEIVRSKQINDFLIDLIATLGALNSQDFIEKKGTIRKNLINLGLINFSVVNQINEDHTHPLKPISRDTNKSQKIPDSVKILLDFIESTGGSTNSKSGINPAFFLFQEKPTQWITRIFNDDVKGIYLNWLRSNISSQGITELESKIVWKENESYKLGENFCAFLNNIIKILSGNPQANDALSSGQSPIFKCDSKIKSIPDYQSNIWATLGLEIASDSANTLGEIHKKQNHVVLTQQEVNILVTTHCFLWTHASRNQLLKYQDEISVLQKESLNFWVHRYLLDRHIANSKSRIAYE